MYFDRNIQSIKMVLGYICQEHGFQYECDTSKSGERVCKNCGIAVTGVSGNIRGSKAPPTNKPTHQGGNIVWKVITRKSTYNVKAFDYINAIEKASDKMKDPQGINKVMPKVRKYRR